MNKEARPFEEYKEMIQDMSKDNMIKGLYDLSANIIEKDKEIERLNNIMQQMIEYIEYSLKNNKSGEREVLQIVLAKLKVELKEGKE